ncbi:MAG TPA: hypothetical protein VFE25_04420 [Opitutaceae bacterium]|jgi:hypothetical protein|nr:hypothetical protein [Opitutaceae bacterium]
MTKKTTKPAKTPAPATKKAAPAPAPAKKSTVAPKIKAAAAPSTPAPAVVAKPKGGRVTIIATLDVGFGNSLFVRGDEPILSWDKGIALGNVDGGKWEIVLTAITQPLQFKFLVNDSTWSAGENFTVSPGDIVTLTPSF